MSKPKRTAAEKSARRELQRKFMTVFINGKQKRVARPQLIEGLPVHEFIARNADPIWLHQCEMWGCIKPEDLEGDSLPTDDDRGRDMPIFESFDVPF